MRFFTFGNNKRPLVGEQNTGRIAYARPFGVATVQVSGLGGANNYGSMAPFNPTTTNAQLVTQASVSGRGSMNGNSENPLLKPIIDREPGTINGNIGINAASFPNTPSGGQF